MVNRWTDAQKRTMQAMRDANVPWPEVAAAVGHSVGSCQTTMTGLRDVQKAAGLYADPHRKLSEHDLAEIARLRDVRGYSWPMIDRKLNLAAGTACTRYIAGTRGVKASSTRAARTASVDRQLQHSSITAAVFGDPLPGRSALDRRAR